LKCVILLGTLLD